MTEHPPQLPRRDEKRHLWDDPANVRRLLWLFFVSCAVMLGLDLVVHRHATFEHGELPIETWFGFYSIYGFVACVLLVLIAKQMRKVLMRPEDYYEGRFESSETAEEGSDG